MRRAGDEARSRRRGEVLLARSGVDGVLRETLGGFGSRMMETFWTSPRGPGARSTRCRRRRRPVGGGAVAVGVRVSLHGWGLRRDSVRSGAASSSSSASALGVAHPTLCAVATAPTLVAPVPASATTSSDDRGRVDCVFRSLPPPVSTSSRFTRRCPRDRTKTFGNSGNFGGGSETSTIASAAAFRCWSAALPGSARRTRPGPPPPAAASSTCPAETCTAIGPPRISPATSAGCARSAASRRPPPAWCRPRWYRARYRRVRAGRRRTGGKRTATSPRPSRCSRAAPTASIGFRGVRRGRNERRDRASGILGVSSSSYSNHSLVAGGSLWVEYLADGAGDSRMGSPSIPRGVRWAAAPR